MLNILKTSTCLTALRGTGMVLVAALLPLPALAQSANLTPENIAVFNLLSPFLNLNTTSVGQQTLQTSLSQAVAINQNAASVALLNDYMSTPALAALAISDENLLGKASNAVTGLSATYGVAANLAGSLPTQNTIAWAMYNGQQPVGGFGSILGAAYVSGVGSNGSAVTLPNTVALLTAAVNQTGNTTTTGDASLAKSYFANGTIDGTTPVVAPAGYTLITSNGLPNKTNSVYDTAFGVSNTQSSQNAYGDSHPYQVANLTLYDSTVKSKSSAAGAPTPSTNPAFPSSHMAYAMTDSLLLGMMVPQLYQSMLMRASEMGESRIVVGVHYPTDIIGSRAFISFDLANLLGNPSYIKNATVTGTAVNLPGLFASAAPELKSQLTQAAASANCGTSLAGCATSTTNVNPYAPSATNAAVYAARLTYGLPTLSFTAAPAEQAPGGGPDASILLATLYGGANSNAATAALAASVGGGLYGNLANSTINQIIVNTETNALAAFYGTSLSYWSRVDLYDAAGYFQNVTGTITLASTDQVNTNVTVANTGTLNGGGTITGNLAVQSGGTLGGTGAAPAITTVNGQVTQGAGSTLSVNIDGKTAGNGAGNYSQINVVGTGNAYVISPAGGSTPAAALQFNLRNITGGNNTYIPGLGSAYTVVQAAGGVSGAFGSLVQPTSGLPANTVFTVAYYPTNVQGYVTPGSYANPVAAGFTPTGNQAGVGSALDRIRAATGYGVSADSNTSVLLGAVGGLSAGNLQAGLDQLSGVGALNAVGNSLTVGRAFGQALDSRLDQLHGADTSIAEKASQGLFGFALNTGTIGGGSVDAGGSAGATTGLAGGDGLIGLSPWVRGIGVFSSNDGDGNAPGFSSTIGGALAGVDYRLNDAFLVGASFGYAHSTVTGNDGTGQSDGDSYRFAGYGTWNPGGFFVDGTAGYTYSEYDTRRDLAMGSFSGTAKGNTSGGDAEVGARVGKRFNLGGFTVVPDAGLTYDHLTTDRFTESGAGAFNLTVGSTTLDSLRSAIGASASQTFQVNEGLTLEPEVRAHWEHDILDQNVQTSMALAGQPFTVSSARPGRDAAVLGVGLAGLIGDRTRLFVSYDASLRENQTDHAITAGFKLVW
jgi:outer membrane autotransporter protein